VNGNERLRVLWFSTTPSSGGAVLGRTTAGGGWIRALEHELRQQVDLSVAFYHDSTSDPYEHEGTTFRPMLRPQTTAVGKARSRLTDSLETDEDVARLMDVVDAARPDVIHVHGTEGPFGLIQRHTDIPVLVSVQSLLSVYELKYFSGLDRATVRRLARPRDRLTRNSYADRYRRFARQAQRERTVLALSRHLTGRTEWDRRVTSVLAPAATYHHLDEILRAPFYGRRWRSATNDVLELFTTTGPNLYKGLETLVRCAALIEEAGVDYRWRVAGLAPGDPFVELFLRALGVDLPSGVVLLGTLEESALADQMIGSDLYVGVSHIENSPNSLCEAQLMGVPCLATYAGGTASLMTDGQEGVLLQDGDPYVMAGAILDLAGDRERAARLGAAGRERAQLRHDRSSVSRAALELYRRLVSSD
jgi:glycosyltransferase involved in cell wall biosynthesis